MVGWVKEYGGGGVSYGKELNSPGYLGQCMVGRVSYLSRVKQGNYHTHVLYTIPNPNYTLPKPYLFIIIYPIHHPTLGTQTGRMLPCASTNTTLPWVPTYPYPSIVIPYRQSAKFQKMLRNHFRGEQMLMKDTTAHSVQWSMPINFQGGDN